MKNLMLNCRCVISIILLSLTFSCYAASPVLQGINVSKLGEGELKIDFEFTAPISLPKSFSTENPPRVIVDFANVQLGMQYPKQVPSIGALQSFEAKQVENRIRVMFSLKEEVSYKFQQTGNHLYLYLTSKSPIVVAAQIQKFSANHWTSSKHRITGIDFKRDKNEGGRVIINLSDASMGINVIRNGNDIITTFVDTSVADRFQKRLDVSDFGTPVQSVVTKVQGGNSEVTVKSTGDYKHLAYQVNNQFIIDVNAEAKQAGEVKEEEIRYTGERLSLDFQDISVRAVLQLLAEFTGINIVASNTVVGNITLRLNDVPWDEALAIVLKTQGLTQRKVGNILMIAPSEEVITREKKELASKKEVTQLESLRTELVRLNYAKASDALLLIKGEKSSLLSERGSVSADERTNTLLIQDTPSQLAEIRTLLSQLDIPVRQVAIEARIVNVDSNFEKDLGIRWGITDPSHISGTLNGQNGLLGGGANEINNNALTDPTANPLIDVPVDGRLNVNLPGQLGELATAHGAHLGRLGIALAKLGKDFLLDLEISALEAEGIGEVISTPKIVTANQHEAYIEKGEEIPYQESTSSGATSIQFKKAVLGLRVTPQITPDNNIIMELAVNQDVRGSSTPQGPAINTRQLKTQVLVSNGQTIVLGGIYEETDRNRTDRIPFLGSLPVVGNLFKNSQHIHQRVELLIFITPRIIEQV